MALTFDPWGPISGLLFELQAERVKNIVTTAGVIIDWSLAPDDPNDGNPGRIRKIRPIIQSAYIGLPPEERGIFSQVVAKHVIASKPGFHELLEERLNDIGWSISSGTLATADAVLSEQFFPPGTPFDAYVGIRDILHAATSSLTVVDGYLGDILTTIASGPTQSLTIRLLTSQRGFQQRPDIAIETKKFAAQFPCSQVELRLTSDFHDRFIVKDWRECYHIGASTRDAGTRAFLISRLEDQPMIDSVLAHVNSSWDHAVVKS